MPIERDLKFLNIDLFVVGRFDRTPLLAAAGREVFVLDEDAVLGNEKCLVLEVAGPGLDLAHTLARLLGWVEGLPPAARRSWRAAARRVFDIGIQAGKGPHETHWTIRHDQVAALAKVEGEVALTVYGAESTRRPLASRSPRRKAVAGVTPTKGSTR